MARYLLIGMLSLQSCVQFSAVIYVTQASRVEVVYMSDTVYVKN